MVLRGHTRGKGLDKGRNVRDLSGIFDSLVGISEREVKPARPPPGQIDLRLAFRFMDRLAAVTLLKVEVGAELDGIGQESRGTDKEIDPIRTHMVPQREPSIPHAGRIGSVVVPDTGQLGMALSTEIRVGKLNP